MQTPTVPRTELAASRFALGSAAFCPWDKNAIANEDIENVAHLLEVAFELGISLIDHADVYAFGKCEALFGRILKQVSGLRERVLIQSKCGQIITDRWPDDPIKVDLSHTHIISSVEASLSRLGTDRLDVLLLHAPDPRVEPEEVARAFDELHSSGKVLHFGVSNHGAEQIALLQSSLTRPVAVNQVRLSLGHPHLLAQGLEFILGTVPQTRPSSAGVRGGTVEFCRRNGIQLQAWSPLRGIFDTGAPRRLTQMLSKLATARNVTPAGMALAWLLRHPARIVPVLGTHSAAHLAENCLSLQLTMGRDEWLELLRAATGGVASSTPD